MCCLISQSLCICSPRLLVSFLHNHQVGSVRSSYQIEFNYVKKMFVKSFHILILILFGLIYQLNIDLVRLS
jgi:hypothetical protein